MPTYDYRCNNCEHEFELFQSMSASHKRKCPECGKHALERLIGTGAAVMFKGSGFYETDYRSESYKKAAKADSGGDKSESKSESKSDNAGANGGADKKKPAATAEKKPAKAGKPAAKKSGA
ncbi:MAG: zinc ribbon domain-containing protein [Planctomycetota bacterium]